jgi:hypothetical protein
MKWHNFELAKLDFESLDFEVTPGSRYLGGFI